MGVVDSQFQLGWLYKHGHLDHLFSDEVGKAAITKKANKKSVEWFEKAAKNNSFQAMHALGLMYGSPDCIGVEFNLKKSAKFFTQVNLSHLTLF